MRHACAPSLLKKNVRYLGEDGKHARHVVRGEVRCDDSSRTTPWLASLEKHGVFHPDLGRGPHKHALQSRIVTHASDNRRATARKPRTNEMSSGGVSKRR